MGKSGKLFKSLVAGIRVFKSPSKECPATDDKSYLKRRSKDKCFGSLGKSASRNHEVISVATASPEAIDIKCMQVESEKLNDVLPLPVAESFSAEPHAENKVPAKRQDGVTNGSGFVQLFPTGSKEHSIISDQEVRAASKIQAAFRCYLAQRAFRALRALVRLQALARGQRVRRHASASLRCVNALIRIQALARGRRVRNSELGQLLQKHLQQSKQSRKKPAESWVNSTATAQQLHAKAQVKHDAVIKRQRALVYSYSEQLNKRAQKLSSSSGLESQIDKSHWIWVWLERWMEATPKGCSAAVIPIEDCAPVTTNGEKAITVTKGAKHLEESRKGRRKWGQPDSISPVPHGDLVSEESEPEEKPIMVMKREEERKSLSESERLQNPNAGVQQPVSPSPSLSPPPSPLKEANATAVGEVTLYEAQLPATEMLPDVIQSTASNCSTEAKVGIMSYSSNAALPTAHVMETEKTWSSEYDIIMTCPMPTSQVSPTNSYVDPTNGHAVCNAYDFSHIGSDSPPSQELRQSSISLLPQERELCTQWETLLSIQSSEESSTPGFSHASHSSPTPEILHGNFLSGMHHPEEDIQATSGGTCLGSADEAVHSINKDDGEHMTMEAGYGINGDVSEISCEAGSLIEEVDAKNDANCVDAFLGTNGGCDGPVVSVSAMSTEVLNKNLSGSSSKCEQAGCISPSVPSYMATTKSAKAKVRSLTSPRQKSDLPKQKLESPKLDSSTTRGNSPVQKLDSASKRRHSLSALDGKVSPGTPKKPGLHVRASSKGNFSLMKDLSTDSLSLSNGDSRRHGK